MTFASVLGAFTTSDRLAEFRNRNGYANYDGAVRALLDSDTDVSDPDAWWGENPT